MIAIRLSGVQMLDVLQKGHIVRRECWVKGFFIRVCNETGYDKDGNITFNDDDDAIYTIATNGYFMHLASSGQPFSRPRSARAGEGIGMLFAKDWEDHGFITREQFDMLIEATKDAVRRLERKYIK